MDDFFDGDLHAGISNIVLEPEDFDLGEGVTIRKTYAHLMAHFVMAVAAPPPNSFHPGPWKAAKAHRALPSILLPISAFRPIVKNAFQSLKRLPSC